MSCIRLNPDSIPRDPLIALGARSLAVAACLIATAFLSGCLQLDTPYSFKERKEIEMRSGNLHKYYEDLEERIKEEQYHIKLLQEKLQIHLTEEQAVSERVMSKKKEVARMKKDLNGHEKELKDIEARLKQTQEKRKALSESLKAEQATAADLEKSIAQESARIVDLKKKLEGVQASRRQLEKQDPATDTPGQSTRDPASQKVPAQPEAQPEDKPAEPKPVAEPKSAEPNPGESMPQTGSDTGPVPKAEAPAGEKTDGG